MKLLAFVVLPALAAVVAGQSIQECLEKDSIACVQKSLYRTAKDFFSKDSYEILSGVSLVRSAADNAGRSARTGKELIYDQEMEAATDVSARQDTLENFVTEEAGFFLTGRSLRINFASMFEKLNGYARSITENAPEEIQQAADAVVEGRGLKKKITKGILPLLIAAKVKIGALATLAYFGIALLAKKAIFASLISIAISGFLFMKGLWQNKGGYHEVTGYNAEWNNKINGGWSPPVSNGGWATGGNAGWDEGHGYAHSQAYSGYHH